MEMGSSPAILARPKRRDRTQREQQITATARRIAEAEGWGAVTIRRLAEAIEYSQPVLYSHFGGRDEIVAAVAIEGFGELAATLHAVAARSTEGKDRLCKAAAAYLAFAQLQPALYEAMFVLPTTLRFAESDTAPQLRDAFAALRSVVPTTFDDRELATETFWASLHGLAGLERTGRIRPGLRDKRIALVVASLCQS